MDDHDPDVSTLVDALNSDSRKYAVFRLQNLLCDPSFADAFIVADGLWPLRQAVLETSGNTQAYALGSLSALLTLDMGWDVVDASVIEKAVALTVTHPLVNIVRNALTLLVQIVSRRERGGFRAVKPALQQYPTFLESLVQRLSASDHTLCANALQLINALMRDAVLNGGELEWPRFIKRLQELGVISGVGLLMRGDAAGDVGSPLSGAILEFQSLTKVLLRRWKEVRVNVELPEHKRALKTVHLLSKPEPYHPPEVNGETPGKGSRKHHPEKWRRLGFETESPAWEFDETGYLGMMDLVDYARRNEDAYQKILMEQSVQPAEQRCPLARASLSVTLILYEHFEIDLTPEVDEPVYHDHLDSRTNTDKIYRPLLLQWGRLHTGALNAFQRLWKVAGAELEDFFKIEEVVRIIVERIVGAAGRRTDIGTVEDDLRSVTLEAAREWQMQGLEEVHEDAWGPHLVQVREQLHLESLQFMKEQRIRCLLQGSWFPSSTIRPGANVAWRYVRLSHNRRWLHYQTFPRKSDTEPPLTDLPEKIDLNTVTSVDSNVSTSDLPLTNGNNSSTETLRLNSTTTHPPTTTTNTKISIVGTTLHGADDESVLLELFPQTSYEASEWLDGLLMLLNQQPISNDTPRLIDRMEDWGVRLRLLNLRWEDVDWEALEQSVKGAKVEAREVPDREGVDEEYWYAMPET